MPGSIIIIIITKSISNVGSYGSRNNFFRSESIAIEIEFDEKKRKKKLSFLYKKLDFHWKSTREMWRKRILLFN